MPHNSHLNCTEQTTRSLKDAFNKILLCSTPQLLAIVLSVITLSLVIFDASGTCTSSMGPKLALQCTTCHVVKICLAITTFFIHIYSCVLRKWLLRFIETLLIILLIITIALLSSSIYILTAMNSPWLIALALVISLLTLPVISLIIYRTVRFGENATQQKIKYDLEAGDETQLITPIYTWEYVQEITSEQSNNTETTT